MLFSQAEERAAPQGGHTAFGRREDQGVAGLDRGGRINVGIPTPDRIEGVLLSLSDPEVRGHTANRQRLSGDRDLDSPVPSRRCSLPLTAQHQRCDQIHDHRADDGDRQRHRRERQHRHVDARWRGDAGDEQVRTGADQSHRAGQSRDVRDGQQQLPGVDAAVLLQFLGRRDQHGDDRGGVHQAGTDTNGQRQATQGLLGAGNGR